ncbi:MAG: hypothetical protein JSV42_10405 [Chloroflexota bacterium]|nr:MAG: hypothetical protein JSV42_10405 [Chloroflexota bacterium]
MPDSDDYCLYCERDSQQVPLIALAYQDKDLWICPQHLPILIHSPAKLADKLPGLANLPPAEEHHHR